MSLKRIIILCLMGCIILTAFGNMSLATEEPSHSYAMAGFDGDNSTRDWNTNLFFVRMQERTGLSFTFTQYADYAQWQAAKADMFEKDQLPDVLFKAELTTEELTRYTDSGQIIDLKPLLQEHAPHFWAVMGEHPEYLAAVTLPNGKIGALPCIVELPVQNAMWINREWLERLRLDMPVDAVSFQKVLAAFLTSDPNRNGRRDEIPLTFFGVWDLKFLSHAFGVAINDYNLYVNEDGQVQYFPMEERFMTFLGWLRELYAEKLLDTNGLYMADALRMKTDSNETVTHGVFFGPNPMTLYPYEQALQYSLLPPLVYEGNQVYRGLVSPVTGGAFAITSACEDPAALLRWVDILYSEEGAIEALAGTLGEDYTVDEQGRWQLAGSLEEYSVERLEALSVYSTGNMPWRFPLAFYNRYFEDEIGRINEELTTLAGFTVNPFAYAHLTGAQRARIIPMQNEMGAYADAFMARIVLGQVEMTDETQAEFLDGLRERGVETFVQEWQHIYDALNQ